MRSFVFILLLAFCLLTTAAVEVNGVELGTPLPVLRQQLGTGIYCGVQADPSPEQIAEAVCHLDDPKLSFEASLKYRPDRFAGQRTHIFYWIFEDRVAMIDLALPTNQFHSVLEHLRAQYGEPVIEESSLPMAEGGVLPNTTARWRMDGALIRYSRHYAHNAKLSTLSIFSARYLHALETRGVPAP